MRLFLRYEDFSEDLLDIEYSLDSRQLTAADNSEGIILSIPEEMITRHDAELSVQDLTSYILFQAAKQSQRKLFLAESCTGGSMAAHLTAFAGSSEVFSFSAVTYSNEIKRQILGVPDHILNQFGAVSPETVREMYKGLQKYGEHSACCAISGIAGPAGGSQEKPVGLVYIAAGCGGQDETLKKWLFTGSRNRIQKKAVMAANIQLIERLLNC